VLTRIASEVSFVGILALVRGLMGFILVSSVW
jgi:hypothetical protein